jgi:hypothetical protein
MKLRHFTRVLRVPRVFLNPIRGKATHRKKPPYLGAHIFVWQKRKGLRYQHHGIYVGRGRVVELAKNGPREISLTKFRKSGHNHRFGIIHSRRQGSHETVVYRAKIALERRIKYNLLTKNCEHFACG